MYFSTIHLLPLSFSFLEFILKSFHADILSKENSIGNNSRHSRKHQITKSTLQTIITSDNIQSANSDVSMISIHFPNLNALFTRKTYKSMTE